MEEKETMKVKRNGYKCSIELQDNMYIGTVKGHPDIEIYGYDLDEAKQEFYYLADNGLIED